MATKRKKSSKLQTEYRKQRRRIQNLIASYRRKGYDVQFELPAIPKRITQASIRRLAKIKPQTVQEKTYGIDYETFTEFFITLRNKGRRYTFPYFIK